MNEACDIRPSDREGIRTCRTCGAVWDIDNGEEGPCAVRRAPVALAVSALFAALRPRGFLGLILWSWAAAGTVGIALVGALLLLERGSTSLGRAVLSVLSIFGGGA